jgi:hypothetical protein
LTASSNPLYSQDRTELNAALKLGPDDAFAVTTMGRLLLRYPAETPHRDLRMDVEAWMAKFGLDEETLYALSRRAWETGYRPSGLRGEAATPVGSGADVTG